MGCSWLDMSSNVTTGSVISSSVGSLSFTGTKATVLFSTFPACVMSSIAGSEANLGYVSISTSLEASSIAEAIVRVYTIMSRFQVCKIVF